MALRSWVVLLLCWFAGAAHAVDPADLLEPDKAFRISVRAVAPDLLEVRYAIANGYYLYRERFKFAVRTADGSIGPAIGPAVDAERAEAAKNKAAGRAEEEPAAEQPTSDVMLGAPQFPAGKVHQDAFFGRVETYRGALAIRIPVPKGTERFTLEATSQGCADAGVCYPPHLQTTKVDMLVSASASGSDGGGLFGASRADAVDRPGASSSDFTYAEDSAIAAMFEGGNLALVLASFFGFGLLLAFTPCMLPMLPILSGIIAGEGTAALQTSGKARAFTLSLAYVLGLAVTYAVAGVAAAYSGSQLAAALQNAWVLGAFALIFVLLAGSMLGFYRLQLPGFLHDRLSAASQRLTGGRIASVAVMGALSAIIVSPCVAAPLAGALLYIAQSGEVATGGAALFVMALGMGAPLVVIGVSEGALLPRAGAWMESVSRFFGFVLLGVAIWIVSPVIPVAAQMLAWAALLIVLAMFLRAIDPLPADASGALRVGKAAGVLALLGGIAMLAGMLAGSRDPLRPLAGVFTSAAGGAAEETGAAGLQPVAFERIRSLAELEARVKSAGRPVMLDFYADWCVTCKEMERLTFTDPAVKERMAGVLLLQADVTANNASDRALLKRFRLFGPPGIIFFDRDGREIGNVRVIGYQNAAKFGRVLDAVVAMGGSGGPKSPLARK